MNLIETQLDVVKRIAKWNEDKIMLTTSDELIKFAIQKCQSDQGKKTTYSEARKVILNLAA